MESGVKTRDLHGVRKGPLRRTNAGQIVGLVQRCQRVELLQDRKPLLVEHDGFAEGDASMHNAVADSGNRHLATDFLEKGQHDSKRGRMVGHLARVERLVSQLLVVALDLKVRRRAEALDLAAHTFDQLRSGIEQRELDRRRSGIQGQNVLHYSTARSIWTRACPPERQAR